MLKQFRKEYGMSSIAYRKLYRVDTFMEQYNKSEYCIN